MNIDGTGMGTLRNRIKKAKRELENPRTTEERKQTLNARIASDTKELKSLQADFGTFLHTSEIADEVACR